MLVRQGIVHLNLFARFDFTFMPHLAIISPTFYPDPAVAGVRMTHWARHLPEFGWTPTVLCRHQGYEADAHSMARDVHPAVAVHYLTPPRSPHRARRRFRIKRWFRQGPGGLLGPNSNVANIWQSHGVRSKIQSLIEQTRPDVVLTTSPPSTIHHLGAWIKQRTGLPWVADFRDPFLIDPRFSPKGFQKLRYGAYARFQASIYHKADGVIHAIPIEHRWARLAYPEARSHMRLILNGCPPELADGVVEPDRSPKGCISVRCVGVAGGVESLALAEAIRAQIDQGRDMELRLVGWPPETVDEIRQRLSERFIAVGKVSHPEALRQIAGADILVGSMSVERSRSLGMSSKLFEFLAVGAPVIMINPTCADRLFFQRRPGVRMLRQPDQAAVRAVLEWALTPEARPPVAVTRSFAEQHNRRTQTGTLAAWLDEILSRTDSTASALR